MNWKSAFYASLTCVFLFSCGNKKKSENSKPDHLTQEGISKELATKTASTLTINPIEHATMVLEKNGTVVYIDPVGGAEKFESYKMPNYILITDIHGDHLNVETLSGLSLDDAKIIAPSAVAEKLPEDLKVKTIVLDNGDTEQLNTELSVNAIPMYNLREEALKFHEKGRGNGYVLNWIDARIYISGDTEDIPEMRNLKNIDKAFVCMNLPYTMPVASAADAVTDFEPTVIYPYHYRGTEGLSDIEEFKRLVLEEKPNIEVNFLNWYPAQ